MLKEFIHFKGGQREIHNIWVRENHIIFNLCTVSMESFIDEIVEISYLTIHHLGFNYQTMTLTSEKITILYRSYKIERLSSIQHTIAMFQFVKK